MERDRVIASRIVGSRQRRIRIVGLVALAAMVVAASFVSVALSSGSDSSQVLSKCSAGTVSLKDAPVKGYQYFAYYNTTNGAIIGVEGRPSCQVGASLPVVGPSLIGRAAVLNVTESAALHIMMPNGYLNAYYVNLTTKQLTLIPGVTFSDSYRAFYFGQPIANGTIIPIPPS